VSRFKINRFVAASRGLAGVLAGALLLCELLATNGQFHQALHHGGKAVSNSCILCLFANGHVDLPPLMPVVTAHVLSSFDSALRMETIVLVDFSYLSSPSRAPPALASLPSVVA
jgi:hypothetical protein